MDHEKLAGVAALALAGAILAAPHMLEGVRQNPQRRRRRIGRRPPPKDPVQEVWLVTRRTRVSRINQPKGARKGGPTLSVVVDYDPDLRVAYRIAESATLETGVQHHVAPGMVKPPPKRPGIYRKVKR